MKCCVVTTHITSNPSGADIEVDGNCEGKTPLTITADDTFIGYEYKITAS
jgi:hypothetical protein